jgi:hypothetical protein
MHFHFCAKKEERSKIKEEKKNFLDRSDFFEEISNLQDQFFLLIKNFSFLFELKINY